MRVLLLADAAFSRREHAFLQRVEFGLLGEGWRVLRAVPESTRSVQTEGLTRVVAYPEIRSRFGRKAALRRFADQLRGASPAIATDADGVLFEIVHAFGRGCWERAGDVSVRTNSALVVELTSSSDIRAARAFERAHRAHDHAPPLLWCTPNHRFFEAVGALGLGSPVRLAPWGVHTPTNAHREHAPDRSIAVSVVCSGEDPKALHPLLRAFAKLGHEADDAMLFLDATATEHDTSVWTLAEQLCILERVTFVADMESRREVVLETDVLAIPEQMGELRTILLDAMAAGMLVMSRRDPLIEATASEGVALLIDEPTTDAWMAALREVIRDPNALREIGDRARTRVREDRPVHKHIEAIIHAYESALTPSPLKMKR